MKYKKAMSLIEIIVTAGLFVIIGTLMVTMIVRGLNSYQNSQELIDAQEKAAQALRDFEKTTRGATAVLSSNSNELVFQGYLLGDMQPAASQVRYYCDSGTLIKGVIHPEGTGPTFTYPSSEEFSQMVVRNVVNCSTLFTYYNDASAQISDPVPADAVRMVKLTVSIDKDITKAPEALTASTSVNLRNLKTNL
jgi:type II secretory pathway pseudopilin PulG